MNLPFHDTVSMLEVLHTLQRNLITQLTVPPMWISTLQAHPLTTFTPATVEESDRMSHADGLFIGRVTDRVYGEESPKPAIDLYMSRPT